MLKWTVGKGRIISPATVLAAKRRVSARAMSGHCIVAFLRKTRCDSFRLFRLCACPHHDCIQMGISSNGLAITIGWPREPHCAPSLFLWSACQPYNCSFLRLHGALLAVAEAVNFSSQGGSLINQPFCPFHDSSLIQLILLSFYYQGDNLSLSLYLSLSLFPIDNESHRCLALSSLNLYFGTMTLKLNAMAISYCFQSIFNFNCERLSFL